MTENCCLSQQYIPPWPHKNCDDTVMLVICCVVSIIPRKSSDRSSEGARLLDQNVIVIVHGRNLLEFEVLIIAQVESNIVEGLARLLVLLHFCRWQTVNKLYNGI